MKHRFLFTGLAVAALGLAGSLATAQATIIGETPNTNFANSSVTFNFGDATFTFSNDPGKSDPLFVKTGGSAQVTLFGIIPNSPASPGGVGGAGNALPTFDGLLGPQTYSYGSFSTATSSPSFDFFGPYIGLKFLLNGDVHYGYAHIDNLDTLVSYAYNSVPDGGIVTGQQITAVPEPSSLAMFGLGLGLIGIGANWSRRRRANRTEVDALIA
jgi:hypothetical protein